MNNKSTMRFMIVLTTAFTALYLAALYQGDLLRQLAYLIICIQLACTTLLLNRP